MAAMTMEEMHERTGQQQQPWEILDGVRPVLGEEKKARDRGESEEDPSRRDAEAAVAVRVVVVLVAVHGRLLRKFS
jgi:hypothetical protein